MRDGLLLLLAVILFHSVREGELADNCDEELSSSLKNVAAAAKEAILTLFDGLLANRVSQAGYHTFVDFEVLRAVQQDTVHGDVVPRFDGDDIADLQLCVVDIGHDAVSQDLKTLALLPLLLEEELDELLLFAVVGHSADDNDGEDGYQDGHGLNELVKGVAGEEGKKKHDDSSECQDADAEVFGLF